jgi:two-component system chemotaxis response regulator CheY
MAMLSSQEHLGKGPRINAIVVDDNKELRALFVELLQLRGVRVMGTGSNGEEAFYLYQLHRPDMVILDAVMLVQDGFYALSKIKELDVDAKVVLVTGSHQEKAMLDNYRANMIIENPVDIEEVMDIAYKLTAHSPENV